jgi:DNA-nicking Smr family endonuclease
MIPDPDPVFVLPITDVLDLHTVPPRDAGLVVEAWLEEVKARGFRALRIIHGRGIGVQREMVRAILARDPDVLEFGDAPAEAGGWGATVITLKS